MTKPSAVIFQCVIQVRLRVSFSLGWRFIIQPKFSRDALGALVSVCRPRAPASSSTHRENFKPAPNFTQHLSELVTRLGQPASFIYISPTIAAAPPGNDP